MADQLLDRPLNRRLILTVGRTIERQKAKCAAITLHQIVNCVEVGNRQYGDRCTRLLGH